MKQVNIRLTSIQDVLDFVRVMNRQSAKAELTSGRYTVGAKSLMGIFTLDLLSPIQLTAYTEDCTELFRAIDKFLVKEEIDTAC